MRDEETSGSFVDDCRRTLARHWAIVEDAEDDYLDDGDFIGLLRELLRSATKSYRYVLPTQLLAKVVDSTLDCCCLQAGRQPAHGNFDARSVNEQVIVPFDKAEGEPLGGSPQPYVNNPLRKPEISPAYREAQKNKADWDKLYQVLSRIERENDPGFTESVFDQTLLEIRRLQGELEVSYPVPQRISLSGIEALLAEFLAPRTGGGRLQAVAIALFQTLQQLWGICDQVRSAGVNVSDASTDRPADIECQTDGRTVLAIEVKDRILTLELLSNQITSARLARVTELLFIIRASSMIAGQEVRERASAEFGSGLNIYLFDADSFFSTVLGLVGENGRRVFLEQIGNTLEKYNLDFRDRRDWAELLKRNWQ